VTNFRFTQGGERLGNLADQNAAEPENYTQIFLDLFEE
jgi:hypothetical protein